MSIRYDGKVAIVPGSGQGLGRSHAIELAKRGAKVVINDLEVHTTKIHAMEFDDQGTMELWFIAIKPGSYKWAIEDFEEKGMTGTFIVE